MNKCPACQFEMYESTMTHIRKVVGVCCCRWWIQSEGSSSAADGVVAVAGTAAQRMLHGASGIGGRSSAQIVLHYELIEVHIVVVAVGAVVATHSGCLVTSIAGGGQGR